MLDLEVIEDTVKIVNEAIKYKTPVNLIISNRAGGNASLVAQKIADRFIRRSSRGCSEFIFIHRSNASTQ
ncbi:MAG: hypothetical protein ABSF48_24800 [Thermodesulfobacteriota bacterium]